MISLTRLNHSEIVVNAELIEFVESTPDTVLTLTTGTKLLVEQGAQEVVARVMAYRRQLAGMPRPRAEPESSGDAVTGGAVGHG